MTCVLGVSLQGVPGFLRHFVKPILVVVTLTAVIKPLLPIFFGRTIVILNFVRRFRNFIADTVPRFAHRPQCKTQTFGILQGAPLSLMTKTIPRTEINNDCPTERYQSQHRLTISISVQAMVFNPLPKTGQLNGSIDKLNGSPTRNRPFRELVFVIKISLWETALSIVANNPPKSTKQWCLWPLKIERWFFVMYFLVWVRRRFWKLCGYRGGSESWLWYYTKRNDHVNNKQIPLGIYVPRLIFIVGVKNG